MIKVEELLKRLDALCIRIAGVDIGENGGFCINNRNGIQLYEMPEDPITEWDILGPSTSRIYAEDVHTFPGQGVVSMGSLMKRKGRLEGFAIAMEIEPNWIQPLTWIKCFTLKRTKHFDNKRLWKMHLLDIANKMFNSEDLNLKTADAFLIWIYAAHKELGLSLTKL